MIRFLLLIFAGYVAYRVVKTLFSPGREIQKGPDGGVIDEMVQDPFCKVYIPRKESIRRVVGGKEFPFCSNQCADKFEAERKA
ncbi:MAG: YHS domain-containing protein [Pseudomonadota bacterium]